jgi:hypothetical protein
MWSVDLTFYYRREQHSTTTMLAGAGPINPQWGLGYRPIARAHAARFPEAVTRSSPFSRQRCASHQVVWPPESLFSGAGRPRPNFTGRPSAFVQRRYLAIRSLRAPWQNSEFRTSGGERATAEVHGVDCRSLSTDLIRTAISATLICRPPVSTLKTTLSHRRQTQIRGAC